LRPWQQPGLPCGQPHHAGGASLGHARWASNAWGDAATGYGHATGQWSFHPIPKRAVPARINAPKVLLSSADSAYSSLAPEYPETMHITSVTRSHDMQAAGSGTDQLLAGAPIRVPSSPSSTITVQVRPTQTPNPAQTKARMHLAPLLRVAHVRLAARHRHALVSKAMCVRHNEDMSKKRACWKSRTEKCELTVASASNAGLASQQRAEGLSPGCRSPLRSTRAKQMGSPSIR